MDYATTLCEQVTRGSCITSLLHEYSYLPCPHRVIHLNTPVNNDVPKRLEFALLVSIPLNAQGLANVFLTLSALLTVENDKRMRNRSPHNAESQKVVKFYCCGNHLLQRQIITQAINLLEWISSRNFTRELDKESLFNQSPIYTKF